MAPACRSWQQVTADLDMGTGISAQENAPCDGDLYRTLSTAIKSMLPVRYGAEAQ